MTAAPGSVDVGAFHGACSCADLKSCDWCVLLDTLLELANEGDPAKLLKALGVPLTAQINAVVKRVRTRAADQLVAEHGGSVDRAADELDVSRAWLYRIKSPSTPANTQL